MIFNSCRVELGEAIKVLKGSFFSSKLQPCRFDVASNVLLELADLSVSHDFESKLEDDDTGLLSGIENAEGGINTIPEDETEHVLF